MSLAINPGFWVFTWVSSVLSSYVIVQQHHVKLFRGPVSALCDPSLQVTPVRSSLRPPVFSLRPPPSPLPPLTVRFLTSRRATKKPMVGFCELVMAVISGFTATFMFSVAGFASFPASESQPKVPRSMSVNPFTVSTPFTALQTSGTECSSGG